jgi:phosphoglycerate dehydrogenase-like enzyme
MRRIIVACDLFLDLRLYRVPSQVLDHLSSRFPGLEIIPVNVPGADIEKARDAEVYWGNRITGETIEALGALKWIHFGSIGVNRASGDEFAKRNIKVTNSRGMMSAPMVASAVAFITGLARGLHHCAPLRTNKNLTRQTFDAHFDEIQDVEGQRCLIVGFGDIGSRLGQACHALGMKVDAIRRRNDAPPDFVSQSYALADLRKAVTDADYIVNLLPFTKETEAVFDRDIFSAMKKTSFFINIGRGETVDEAAMIEALANKTIAAAGLDVFLNEPLDVNSPLWDLQNVILTPHVSGLSQSYWSKQSDLFEENLGRYLNGDTLKNNIDLKSAY